MTHNPGRILTHHTVTAMAGTDTIAHIVERVKNLLAAGRRITLVERYTHTDGTPEVFSGLTVEEVRPGREGGIGVHLKPGRRGFGIHAYGETEPEAWARYHREYRERLTLVDITGGLPGNHPTLGDRLVIRHWISDRVCREWVVVFDDAPDIRQEVENLSYWLDGIREALDRQADVSVAVERIRAILRQAGRLGRA
ncbi:hypothetical protein [Micromonospora sp. WMMD737]|uniref:hypothetical protein n=1 Tax=Micromonospora sp. WMMD737 TaxID=3404113 RepID=UPI003B964DB3